MSPRTSLPLRSRLATAVLATLLVPAWALAQEQQDQDSDDPPVEETSRAGEATDLDRIAVTGSRIARAAVEGPAPVMVVTAEEIERQGFSTVWESLGTLTQFTGDAMDESDQTGQSPNGQFMNLRGLGPGYQLILLNGQRMADYPQPYGSNGTAVSLGSIPASAIERIEVMSGGASAIYGSDAVAGVVNVITRNDYHGDTFRLRAGTTSRGGGDTSLFQWVGGRSGDRWNVLYSMERLDRQDIVASQRDLDYWAHPQYSDPDNVPTAALGGVLLMQATGDGGWNYLWPGEDGELSQSYESMLHACSTTNPVFVPYHGSVDDPVANRCGNYNYYDGRSLQNSYGKTSGYLAGTFDFSSTLQGYAQLLVNRSEDKSSSQTHYFIGTGPLTAYDPELGRVQAQRSFEPGEVGGTTHIVYDERAWNLNFGLRGTMFNDRFDWDASATVARFDIYTQRPRFLSNEVTDWYFGPSQGMTDEENPVEIREVNVGRLFAPGSPEIYDDLTTVVNNDGSSKVDQLQFVFSGPLFDMPAGPVQMAAVLEAARQDYDLRPDPRITVDYEGDERVYNLTGTPGGGPRDRYALGLEFRVPLLDTLEATLAGRYDHYDDISSVGGASTWQAGLEWRPHETLLLRGSHATSFRAPDLLWVYAGTTGSNPFITDEYLCRLDGLDPESQECVNAHNYQSYRTQSSNPALREETGESTTLGVVWDALPNLSINADYYLIDLEGRVQVVNDRATLEQEAACRIGTERDGTPVEQNSQACQFFFDTVERPISDSNPEGHITRYATYPINQSRMKTSGIDAGLRWSQTLGRFGGLGVQASYTHVLTFETAQFPDDPLVDSRSDLQYNAFRSRMNWRVNWAINDWNTSIYGYRWGSRPVYNTNSAAVEDWGRMRIKPYMIWNADVSKRITDQATLGFSVLNVLNKMPPQDPSHTPWPYYAPRAYSPIGRQMYFNFTYDF